MASACVNDVSLPPSYGCFSPRISFSRDFPPCNGSDPADDAYADPDLGSSKDLIAFEFHLNDPVAMLPADELFSDGKLVPLHLAPLESADPPPVAGDEARVPPETPLKPAVRRRDELIGSGTDSFAVSPKAPTCSSRWRELLRLKRQQQQTKTDPRSDNNPNPKSLKHFLNRNLRSSSSSSDPNLSLPLLRDSESRPLSSISSRLSLSSTSSSSHDAEDLPRLSLDSENKPNQNPILLNRNSPKVSVASSRARSGNADGRVSVRAGRSPVRRPAETVAPTPRCASVDSPRMNASGKVVFPELGRSASSPSTFNGGSRIKHRGMDRLYSANVRVTPVLNVPVCSLRGGSKSFGFGQLFSGSGSGLGSGSVSKNGSGGGGGGRGKN